MSRSPKNRSRRALSSLAGATNQEEKTKNLHVARDHSTDYLPMIKEPVRKNARNIKGSVNNHRMSMTVSSVGHNQERSNSNNDEQRIGSSLLPSPPPLDEIDVSMGKPSDLNLPKYES